MGFDLYGEAPKKESGEYFRNSVWWWRPLWIIVQKTCADFLSDDDLSNGEYNIGWLITKDKADKIAKRLTKRLADPDFRRALIQEEKKRVAASKAQEDLPFDQQDFSLHYPISIQNIKDFAKFCRNSGGFKIC